MNNNYTGIYQTDFDGVWKNQALAMKDVCLLDEVYETKVVASRIDDELFKSLITLYQSIANTIGSVSDEEDVAPDFICVYNKQENDTDYICFNLADNV